MLTNKEFMELANLRKRCVAQREEIRRLQERISELEEKVKKIKKIEKND